MSHSTCLSLSLICLLASAVLSAEKSKDIFSFTSMGLEEEIPSSHCWLSSQCSEDKEEEMLYGQRTERRTGED
ncbi:hypothetical protein CesoFtcFv8_007348 [Champsocephalus esox]|uniref:Uncharacterized protein n=2 Tax=Champsocephalus TaxID=52236 RepID=A0AAN8HU14_CHAGU|nr:hypothetical protein CesoFtcFv8_007348 [Champsocephalus esox]KAK5927833.1 hypothetical protein CgunFtcFv8_012948 [Champsocephalus gunnari]